MGSRGLGSVPVRLGSEALCKVTNKRHDSSTSAAAAKRLRTDGMQGSTKILIPSQTAGAVIGKQGSGLKHIHSAYSVQVELLQSVQAPQWPHDRVVILKGSLAARQAAVDSVLRTAF